MVSQGPETTRMELLYAAALEIGERGYSGASLSSIAARIGVTKGAFAYHFPTKVALAAALMEHFGQVFTEAVIKARLDFPDDDLRTALRALRTLEVKADSEPLVGAAFTLLSDPRPPAEQIHEKFRWWVDTFMHFLANAQTNGQVLLTVPVAEAAEFLVISLLTLINLSHRTLVLAGIKERTHLRLLFTAIGVTDVDLLLTQVLGCAGSNDRIG